MIEDSDNDATTALLEDEGGYKAPDKLFNKLGMADSAMDESAWGYSLTTASDQVTLLRVTYFMTAQFCQMQVSHILLI